jgi:hypothetical protein
MQVMVFLWFGIFTQLSLLQPCDTYTIQHQSISSHRRPIRTVLSMTIKDDDDIPTATKVPIVLFSKNIDRVIHRRHFLSFGIQVGSISIPIITGNIFRWENVNAILANDNNHIENNSIDSENTSSSTTTQLFNADGSLKDSNQVIAAQERTIQLLSNNNDNTQTQIWIDGKVESSSNSRPSTNQNVATTTATSIQYNLPQKWDNNYIDSTTKERACTHISVYQIPYKVTKDTKINNDDNNRKKVLRSSRQSISNIQLSDIVNILPNDSTIYQSLRDGDLISGNVRQNKIKDDDDDTTIKSYYEYDVAIAPKTCSGTENEDLRLGFCPYESIYLLSAYINHDAPKTTTTTTDNNNNIDNPSENAFLTILIIESTRSEWKRANADLRRIRSSFNVQ